MGDHLWTGKPPRHRTKHPGRLSLSIHQWVGKSTSTGCGSSHKRERNGESCVTVGPVTRTAGIPAYSRLKVLDINGAGHPVHVGHMLASLRIIGVNPHWLRESQRGRAPSQQTLAVFAKSCSSSRSLLNNDSISEKTSPLQTTNKRHKCFIDWHLYGSFRLFNFPFL